MLVYQRVARVAIENDVFLWENMGELLETSSTNLDEFFMTSLWRHWLNLIIQPDKFIIPITAMGIWGM